MPAKYEQIVFKIETRKLRQCRIHQTRIKSKIIVGSIKVDFMESLMQRMFQATQELMPVFLFVSCSSTSFCPLDPCVGLVWDLKQSLALLQHQRGLHSYMREGTVSYSRLLRAQLHTGFEHEFGT